MAKPIDLQLAAAACKVLHNVFYNVPKQSYLEVLTKSKLLDSWPSLKSNSIDARNIIKCSLETNTHSEIEQDFYRLFVGPGKMLAYPWGSVYTDKENLLFGETTTAFKKFCECNDIKFDLKSNEPVDHIGLILGAMSLLFEQAASYDEQQGIKTLLIEHLLPWSEHLLTAIDIHANTDFYRGFGKLLGLLLNDWQQELKLVVIERPIYM